MFKKGALKTKDERDAPHLHTDHCLRIFLSKLKLNNRNEGQLTKNCGTKRTNSSHNHMQTANEQKSKWGNMAQLRRRNNEKRRTTWGNSREHGKHQLALFFKTLPVLLILFFSLSFLFFSVYLVIMSQLFQRTGNELRSHRDAEVDHFQTKLGGGMTRPECDVNISSGAAASGGQNDNYITLTKSPAPFLFL